MCLKESKSAPPKQGLTRQSSNKYQDYKMKPPVSLFRWLLGMALASIFSMTYILAPPYVVTSILALLFRYPTAHAAGIYAIPLILSIFTPSKSRPWIVSKLTPMLDYFQFEMIIEDKATLTDNMLNKGKNYIFGVQPHGIISFCGMCSAIHPDGAEYRNVKTAVASALLHIPILKNVMGIYAMTDASGSNLRKVLKQPGAEGSVVIYIGGMAELFMSSRQEERLYLNNRKGFIKLALREGVDIVPIYLFGNTSVLSVIKNGPLAAMSRKLKLSFTWFWGKYNLPIPRDDKLLYVAGKPIEIPKIAEPTQEDIDKYHKIYTDEVVRLFYTYKHEVPLYANKTLFIE
jgi:hypothetical protein